MSNSNMVAYVAIRRFGKPGGGAEFAYLPHQSISLPKGWEWNVINGVCDTEDVLDVAKSMRLTSLDETCHFMCQDTGIEWEVNRG